ncbi:MAG TPA: geranylgeranyl reductase family protein [Acidimicrobiales bacterium]
MRVADVVVVGAGPGGVAAAVALARSGRQVVLIDRATFPRDKCCGDGLTTGALRELDDLGLVPSAVASWQALDGCRVRSPSGRVVDLPFPATGLFGAVARRTDLDAALVDLARRAGAEVREGHAFRDLRSSTDGITIDAAGIEPIAARYLVAADGMWSPVRKAAGVAEPGYLGEWHAFRQYLRAPGPLARHLWVWFEPDLLPGYAWSFPLPDGSANVGFGIRRRPGEPTRSMADTWRRLLALPHIGEVLGSWEAEAPHKAWPIPCRLPSATWTALGGRVLLVGDAARAGDPMTGEGIGQALETGRLAAQAILAAGPVDGLAAGARYERALRGGMVIDHRLADMLSRLLQSSVGARGAVRAAGISAWSRRNFARWLFEDYPRAALATPWRWPATSGAYLPGAGA